MCTYILPKYYIVTQIVAIQLQMMFAVNFNMVNIIANLHVMCYISVQVFTLYLLIFRVNNADH